MRYSFLLLILLFAAISCGKKRVITGEGNTYSPFDTIHWQTYSENDSAFKVWFYHGNCMSLAKAVSSADLNDSTFYEIRFYPKGEVQAHWNFVKGKPSGEMNAFYKSGSKQCRNVYENGNLSYTEVWYESGKSQMNATIKNGVHTKYESWNESGQLETKEEVLSESIFHNQEFFENGNLMKEETTDLKGNGKCVYYHFNGKPKQSGQLLDFKPAGIWKIFDSLGNPVHDTLFLAEGPLKRK